MNRLQNKIAIVTGAASGLGKAIALLYAREGAKVLAADYKPETLAKLANEAKYENLNIVTTVADMSKPEDIKEMFIKAIGVYGSVDILVNNAGIMDDFSPVADVNDDMWDKVMAVNLNGPMQAMREALKIMLPAKKGNIINIASVGGLRGGRAGAAYTTSKHALIGLTKNTGYIYAKSGVRCNAIAPGAMKTNIAADMDLKHLIPLAIEALLKPAGSSPRTADAAEVANLALFLASNEASFVNGAVMVADGGWIAY